MKKLFFLVLAAAVAVSVARAGDDFLRREFLEGIKQVESAGRMNGPDGRKQEAGGYQFRYGTWRMLTKAPFRLARTDYAEDVANRYYDYICRVFAARGIPATNFNIAVAWNAGPGAVIGRQIPSQSREYAERVCNLAEMFAARRLAMTPRFHLPAIATNSRSTRADRVAPIVFTLPTAPALAMLR